MSSSVARRAVAGGNAGVELTSHVSDTSTLGVNMAEYVLGSSLHDTRLHPINHRYVSRHN